MGGNAHANQGEGLLHLQCGEHEVSQPLAKDDKRLSCRGKGDGHHPDGRRVSALKKTSRADFVYEMQKLAKETGLGNVLPPGEDMSRDMITRTKDIASESRLNLIFDTQTQQAQSYGYYKQGQDPAILDAYPAQRFIRAEQRKEPRPLHQRNRNEVRRKDDMEFWLRMNDQSIGGLGVPFGPWGFNSGMDGRM